MKYVRPINFESEKAKYGYYIRYKDGREPKFLGENKEKAIRNCNNLPDKYFPFNKNGRAEYWFEKNLGNKDYFWANVECDLD